MSKKYYEFNDREELSYIERRCSTLICQQKKFQVRKIIIGRYIKNSSEKFQIDFKRMEKLV